VSRYQKGNTNLDFTEARYSEWQWYQLGHMQVCTSLQTDNHAWTSPLSFYMPDALPAAQPTASKHWRLKEIYETVSRKNLSMYTQTSISLVAHLKPTTWRQTEKSDKLALLGLFRLTFFIFVNFPILISLIKTSAYKIRRLYCLWTVTKHVL